MNKQCSGCGITLQNEHSTLPGYVKDQNQDYCVSCYRLKHYGDLSKVTNQKVDPFEILEKISNKNALFVWVIDLFHLEESKIGSLHRWFSDQEVVILATKRELFPQTMSLNKIKNAIIPFIKESHLNVVDVLITGKYGKMNKETNIERLNQLRNELKKDQIVFFGKTNVGKSSLINALTNREDLSVSVLPGTTIDLIKIESEIHQLYDTPGISMNPTLLDKLSPSTVKALQQKKPIKPINFQLKGPQALVIDGFGYFEFDHNGSYSVTCYLPDSITIHRSKIENVANQFARLDKERNELLNDKLVLKSYSLVHKNSDVVIMDLGFITIHDSAVKVKAVMKESIELVVRKAIL